MRPQSTLLKSGIYHGWVRHRRYSPKRHDFKYRVFMMYLDLDELDKVFALSSWWSKKSWHFARFKRSDYLGDPKQSLSESVRHKVKTQLGVDVDGPIRLLTNLRYFGFIINPISVYYCFDKADLLQAMVLEVTNTPWGEKVQYVLRCDPNTHKQRITFNKEMHVSPFHPMSHFYDWRSNVPKTKIAIHMENKNALSTNELAKNSVVFDATLSLQREEISSTSLRRILLQYPFMTLKVVLSIYWQALKIWKKGIPVQDHPNSTVSAKKKERS
ncbi:DUF1365 domain-containing protein [Marinomonas sp. 15G1-11]|uniref:DUF1365 domain-containing protein n=1 Tax=Marinomonas phaeophyticola TaxID=3004091 RepID=A0ABT4JTF6_9GAMM|nr:DUF1365 domain-containing protein [Marinomonas sp. 15G1-11]MCZ2721307.1 DUF1365 domain-containing protein [Marinomonas sp. 15G1-11]